MIGESAPFAPPSSPANSAAWRTCALVHGSAAFSAFDPPLCVDRSSGARSIAAHSTKASATASARILEEMLIVECLHAGLKIESASAATQFLRSERRIGFRAKADYF